MAGIGSEHARDVREAVRIVASDPDLGPATLSDAPAMPNLLKDLLPDAPREKNLLVAAAEARLAAMMLDHVYQGIDATSAIRLAAASFGANTPLHDRRLRLGEHRARGRARPRRRAGREPVAASAWRHHHAPASRWRRLRERGAAGLRHSAALRVRIGLAARRARR